MELELLFSRLQRKEQGNRCFVGAEKYVMWAIIVAAITSIYMLLTGNIKM